MCACSVAALSVLKLQGPYRQPSKDEKRLKVGCSSHAFLSLPPPSSPLPPPLSGLSPSLSPSSPQVQQVSSLSFISSAVFYLASLVLGLYLLLITLMHSETGAETWAHTYTNTQDYIRISYSFELCAFTHPPLSTSFHPSPVTRLKSDVGFHSNCLCLYQTGVSWQKGCRARGVKRTHTHTHAHMHSFVKLLISNQHVLHTDYF